MSEAFFEEVSFRALFQERLNWFLPDSVAIGVVSVIFGIGHWVSGDPVIGGVDVLLVIVDSILNYTIFAWSKISVLSGLPIVWLICLHLGLCCCYTNYCRARKARS